jgi:sigma-B regulation protein RsbU (phosphoserine phosphatase)
MTPTTLAPSSAAGQAASDRITQSIFKHAARISKAQDLPELIRLNAEFARDLVGADRCSLWLVDEAAGELWTMVAQGIEPLRIPITQGLVGACVREADVLVVNDLDRDPRFLRTIDAGSGYRTEQVLCVPMRSERRVLGVLQLLNKAGGFSEGDAGLVGLLAQFAASAIESERFRRDAESARLLRHELDLARDVQARLLPQGVPSVKGLSIAGWCRPAKMVGGDYYDLVPLGERYFAFTLGDVSGKGVAAAVMMASIQTLLRSLLQRSVYEQEEGALASAVGELNRALYISSTSERYSTLFCGTLDLVEKEFTYVNAGHVPPLLLSAAGKLSSLEESGVPVGLLPSYPYQQTKVKLQAGDLILVVSDGMVEACNSEGEFWDEDEVGRILVEHGQQPVGTLPKTLSARVDAWAGGSEQYDDMTVVAVRLD